MHLSNCEHPKLVYSKATDSFLRVPCGKCATCCDTRAKRWINRLDQESQAHRYTFMVTLTYDDEHLPAYFLSDDMEYLECNRSSVERIPLQELVDLCKDEYGEYLEDDLDYLRSRLVHPLGLPCVCTKDLSDFFKRFNKYCFKHITNHYENIRYFCAWEYGPTTYRPHCHILVWFDEGQIATRFSEIISSTWTFGRTDASAVYSNGGQSYVAQYLNRPTHLAAFYAQSQLRPRSQFSKQPSIGSLPSLDKGLRRIYDELPVKRTVWNSRSNKYVDVPFDQSFKDRYFPKCPQYSERSHYDRVTLYGATQILPSETFRDFRFALDTVEWCAYRNIASDDERDLVSYYRKVSKDASSPESLTSTLYRWYSISKRVVWLSRLLGVSLDDYVSHIEEFYSRVDYENLKCQLQFQVDYVENHHSVSDLIHLFPEFSRFVSSYLDSEHSLPSWVVMALESFDIYDSDDFVPLENTYDYVSMSTLHNSIYRQSHKRMHINTYRDFKLEVTDPQLASIVRKYQKYKNVYE